MLPEGVLERWLLAEGAMVEAGKPVAAIRIEDALHNITAPATGRLTETAAVNSVVEPGTSIGRIELVER
jgi:pyruvate/2-oxoglutarate dehydrogenase complex dihydrolipoamide acyltransferase (E2) component